MPKVGKVTRKILGQSVTLDIYYSQSSSFSIPKIAQEIINVTGVNFHGYQTEGQLITALDKALAYYHKAKTEKRKVIAYVIGASTKMTMHQQSRGNYVGYKDWCKGKNIVNLSGFMADHFDGYAFGIQYRVLYEVKGQETKYHYVNEGNDVPEGWYDDDGTLGRDTYLSHKEMLIDWTPEREKAFQEICDGLERMAVRASEILFDTSKTMQLLDSGVKLLKS